MHPCFSIDALLTIGQFSQYLTVEIAFTYIAILNYCVYTNRNHVSKNMSSYKKYCHSESRLFRPFNFNGNFDVLMTEEYLPLGSHSKTLQYSQ